MTEHPIQLFEDTLTNLAIISTHGHWMGLKRPYSKTMVDIISILTERYYHK